MAVKIRFLYPDPNGEVIDPVTKGRYTDVATLPPERQEEIKLMMERRAFAAIGYKEVKEA